jgi:2-polyprenyl-3-methyl-5-hydroxy-6-metoxy-1,4-benzoquinol methylase
MTGDRLTDDQLREFYREGYVSKYPAVDNGRLTQQLEWIPLRPQDRVVDFACGNGLLLDLIHEKVQEYVGVDFSSEFIEDAEKRMRSSGIANGVFHCTDIIEFCKGHSEAFDVAFASDFAEHVYDNDFVAIFEAIKKCLKPGGKLYTHTPNGGFLLERLKARGILKQLDEHIAIRRKSDIEDLLSRCGFEDIRCHRLRHYRWYLSWGHAFTRIPGCVELFSARLLFECRRGSNP